MDGMDEMDRGYFYCLLRRARQGVFPENSPNLLEGGRPQFTIPSQKSPSSLESENINRLILQNFDDLDLFKP